MLSMPAALASRRPYSRKPSQQSTASTEPFGPTRRASCMAVSPNPQPASTTASPARTAREGNTFALCSVSPPTRMWRHRTNLGTSTLFQKSTYWLLGAVATSGLPMEDLLSSSGADARQPISKAERRRPGFDQLVHLARTGDLDPVDQVALLVATRFDARRAGPQPAAARDEVLHEGGQRFQRVNDQPLDGALAHEINGRAGEENRNLQSGGEPAIGDGECDRRPFIVHAVGDEHHQLAGRFSHIYSPSQRVLRKNQRGASRRCGIVIAAPQLTTPAALGSGYLAGTDRGRAGFSEPFRPAHGPRFLSRQTGPFSRGCGRQATAGAQAARSISTTMKRSTHGTS